MTIIIVIQLNPLVLTITPTPPVVEYVSYPINNFVETIKT